MTAPLRIGILGCASIADRMIEAAANTKTAVVQAVASRDAARAAGWAETRGVPHSFGSYDELLGSNLVDAVYVPLPNSLHAAWSIAALEAGLPVLCEKPLCTHGEEAGLVAMTARKANLPLLEGYMYRYHPQWTAVRDMLDQGVIGELSTMESCFTWMCDDRSEIPASDTLGGGALLDVGGYCVHLARTIAGDNPWRVAAFERRSEVDDTMLGLLDFPGRFLARFETSIANYERHRVEIAGTRGAIVVENPWVAGTGPATIILHRENEEPRSITVPGANAYTLQLEHFVELVRRGGVDEDSLEDSLAQARVVDALFASALTGRVHSVD